MSRAVLSGAIYIFYSANGMSGWTQTSKLLASDGAASELFGISLSMRDNVIVVGAYDVATAGLEAGLELLSKWFQIISPPLIKLQ